VSLNEQETWVLGNIRWGARHEGRTYLFQGPEEQKRFLANPGRYAPVLSCNDVVLAVDQNRTVAGQREFGVWFPDPKQGRVFLFSSEETLRKFHTDAERYLEGLTRLGGNPLTPGGYDMLGTNPAAHAQAFGPRAGSYR
jgi:YHS domain-containing protein